MDYSTLIIDPDAKFGKRYDEAEQLSTIAAVISLRWGVAVLERAFGLHPQTIKTMRNGRRGKYAVAHHIIEQLGKEQFVKIYLLDETVNKVSNAVELMKVMP